MEEKALAYELLLEGLQDSRERLRVMRASDEQQSLDLTNAFYRLESAIAAIRSLLAEQGSK